MGREHDYRWSMSCGRLEVIASLYVSPTSRGRRTPNSRCRRIGTTDRYHRARPDALPFRQHQRLANCGSKTANTCGHSVLARQSILDYLSSDYSRLCAATRVPCTSPGGRQEPFEFRFSKSANTAFLSQATLSRRHHRSRAAGADVYSSPIEKARSPIDDSSAVSLRLAFTPPSFGT